MTRLLEKLFEFCASLKLAIIIILSLAFYLGSATFYEKYYGTAAVKEMIYGSQPFILIMALLAINVLAAVIIRFPWKRKQIGFIITHAGIETLLLGCLISFRLSVDGKMSLAPGNKADYINLNDEQVGIDVPDTSGKERRYVFPVNLWKDAGYPGMAEFIGQMPHIMNDGPPEPQWPEGHKVEWRAGPGTKIEVLDWLPAAVPETVIKATPDGFPAAIVHLGGHLPNGMPMDQTVPLLADGQGQGMQRLFGGAIEIDLWRARSDDELHEFLNPPDPKTLPEMGRVAIFIDGKRYPLDITKESLGKLTPLGDSGYQAAVEDYILHAPTPELPQNHGQAAMAVEPIDPQIRVSIAGPKGVRKYLVAAWHPQFMAPLNETDASKHGMANADDPLVWYMHPQTYFTSKQGTRGRLQLLQGLDGKLYARMFELQDSPTQKPGQPFEVQVGKELQNFWLSISLTVTQHCPSGLLVDQFRQAHVDPNQMDQHPRAIQLAIDIDGQRQETWLELGAPQPVSLNTSRGPVALDYSFQQFNLGFSLGLDHAEQTNDPGSQQAAAYTSGVTIDGTGTQDGSKVITMNEPITVGGLTFYQAGFDNSEGMPISTLSIRRDPGWVIKYLGCAMIVGGIFTMFYMKAYFQKSPAAIAAKPARPIGEKSAEPFKPVKVSGAKGGKLPAITAPKGA